MSQTPLKSIRRFCVQCVGGEIAEVRTCGGDHCLNGGSDEKGVCLFFRYRMGRGRPSIKLIRKTCLWCMGNSSDMVKDCGSTGCALWAYRFGSNPAISDETRMQRRVRAKSGNLIAHAVTGRGVSGKGAEQEARS